VSTPLAILLFLGSLALTLAAAGLFADKLDHVGPRLGLPEAVVGLLTALAADAPELSAAIVALARGEKDVSMGVVVGASSFNFATMIGVSALVAGTLTIGRRALAVEAVVGLAAAIVAAGVVLWALPAWLALGLFGAVAAPYLLAVSRRPAVHPPHEHRHGALWKPASLIVPAIALIVVGSTGMVRSAIMLADRWDVSKALVGFVLLAALTSLPNAYTGIRLALDRRGEAVVAETLGSNTINLTGGILVPALVVGLAARTGLLTFNLLWLLAMTAIAIALLALGIDRRGGVLLVALYAVFVAVQLGYA
jgi:cation:H+ antiporter